MQKCFQLLILILLSSLLPTTSLLAHGLPKADFTPGGIAVIAVEGENNRIPRVYYNRQRVMVLPSKIAGQFWAVIGIPLQAKTGEQTYQIQTPMGEQIWEHFDIEGQHYPKEYLHFPKAKSSRKVKPNLDYLARLQHEKEHIQRVLEQWSENHDAVFPFHQPVRGRFASPFGLHRYYNSVPGSQHSGLDIAAPTGRRILAAASGRVADTGRYLLTGNTVIIDHGYGLFTIYAHMNRIHTAKGQWVKAGDIIGLVGKTGRATGPHLHWGVVLNGARVNPKLLLHNA